MSRKISYKHIGINSAGTFLSRITGILRINVLNHLFGAYGDVFWAAFRIPNSLRRIFGEGAISNSFIPVFQKTLSKDKEKAFLFANNVINIFLLSTLFISVCGMFLAPLYFPFIVKGFENNPHKLHAAIVLLIIMMPFTVLISMFAILMGILNSFKKFTSPAFAPLFFNLTFIIVPILLYTKYGIYSTGIAVLIGGLIMVMVELIELKGTDFRYRFYINIKSPYLKEFLKLFFPTSLNMLMLQLTSVVTIWFMSFYSGAMVIIQNAFILNQAPIGIFAIAIGTVILPLLSKTGLSKEKKDFSIVVNESLMLFLTLMLPITIFFMAFPDLVTNLAYRDILIIISGNTGKFSASLIRDIYEAVFLYSIAIFPWGLNIVFSKIFYSIHDAKTPLYANIIILITTLISNILFFKLGYGFKGIIFADLLAAWVTTLFYALQLKLHLKLSIVIKHLAIKFFQIVFISFILIIPLYYLNRHYYISLIGIKSFVMGSMEMLLFFGAYFVLVRKLNIIEI